MDLEIAKFTFTVANTVITGAIGLYVYAVNRHRVTNERISHLEEVIDSRLDDHATRIARLEQDGRHAVSHDDIKRLHARLDDLAHSQASMAGEFRAANKTLDTISQHLMTKGI